MEPLLKNISVIIPDKKINQELYFYSPERGPKFSLKPSQMYRCHLLLCLKRVASFRQLRMDLIQHKSWRSFAHLKNKQQVPSLRAFSEFRQHGVSLLKQINQQYCRIIFSILPVPLAIVAVPDSTDVRAATKGFPKKTVYAPNLVIIQRFIRPFMLQKDTEQRNRDSRNGSSVTRNTPCALSCLIVLLFYPSPL